MNAWLSQLRLSYLMGWCPAALKHRIICFWFDIRPKCMERRANELLVAELRRKVAARIARTDATQAW